MHACVRACVSVSMSVYERDFCFPGLLHCWLCAGLKVLIYSGDHDMCVPHTGSEAWTSSLGLKVKEPWRPWKVDHQVATRVCIMCNQLQPQSKHRRSQQASVACDISELPPDRLVQSITGAAVQHVLHDQSASAYQAQILWSFRHCNKLSVWLNSWCVNALQVQNAYKQSVTKAV